MASTALDLSLGAIEIGVLLASVLYGMSVVLGFIYATTDKKDEWWLKLLVSAVCLLETLHIITIYIYLYHLTIVEFGAPLEAILQMPWYLGASVAIQALAGTLVQVFYIRRIHILSGHNYWLSGPPATAAALKTAAAFVSTIVSRRQGITIHSFAATYGYVVYMATISSVLVDVWSMGVLCWLLVVRSTRHSRMAVNRIVLLAVESGSITSVAAVLILIFWAMMPTNGVWIAATLVYSHLYSNSLFISLNARSKVQGSLRTPQAKPPGSGDRPRFTFTSSGTHHDESLGAQVEYGSKTDPGSITIPMNVYTV